MSMRFTTLRQNRWLAGLLVVALALRALIPVGFMPSGDGKVALEICPEGFPAALLHGGAHASHGDGAHGSHGDALGSHGREVHHHHAAADPSALAQNHSDASQAQGHNDAFQAQGHSDTSQASAHAESAPAAGHDHKSWMQGHCPFAAAVSTPALCNLLLVALADLQAAAPLPETAIVAADLDFRFVLAQPRAPPIRLV